MIAPVGLRVGRGLLFTSKRSLVERIDVFDGFYCKAQKN
jgi:hypothetical protein